MDGFINDRTCVKKYGDRDNNPFWNIGCQVFVIYELILTKLTYIMEMKKSYGVYETPCVENLDLISEGSVMSLSGAGPDGYGFDDIELTADAGIGLGNVSI